MRKLDCWKHTQNTASNLATNLIIAYVLRCVLYNEYKFPFLFFLMLASTFNMEGEKAG